MKSGVSLPQFFKKFNVLCHIGRWHFHYHVKILKKRVLDHRPEAVDPYLSFSRMLMAILAGVKLDLGIVRVNKFYRLGCEFGVDPLYELFHALPGSYIVSGGKHVGGIYADPPGCHMPRA